MQNFSLNFLIYLKKKYIFAHENQNSKPWRLLLTITKVQGWERNAHEGCFSFEDYI